jgi:hypothetical protein
MLLELLLLSCLQKKRNKDKPHEFSKSKMQRNELTKTTLTTCCFSKFRLIVGVPWLAD